MLLPLWLAAQDDEARNLLKRADEAYQKGDYGEAADQYAAAEIAADDTVIKANAARDVIRAHAAAGMLYKEFEKIEYTLDRYSSYVNVSELISREYQLGALYFAGKRSPAFWSLRWIPWLTDRDKTIEIYKAALKRAPFAPESQIARLHLANKLICDGKPQEALPYLRESVKHDSPEKYVYLQLGEQLYLLAQQGDGNGQFNQEACEVLREFQRRFPNAEENDLVDKWLLRLKDVQGKRLLDIAKFYHKSGRDLAAERYLNEVIRKYPDSLSAEKSTQLLVEIDKSYVPENFAPEIQPRIQSYSAYPLPVEMPEILLLPQESNGKYLLPVYDLGIKPKEKEKK